MESNIKSIEYDIKQIIGDIKYLKSIQSYDVDLSYTRHNELVDLMLTLKILSEKRHETILYCMYFLLLNTVLIALKVSNIF